MLHLAMASLFKASGTRATNIPFQSSAESVAAVMGNHVEAAATHPNLVQAGLADGSLRILGVFSDARIPSMPNVPTIAEAGYDISLSVYNVILVPAGVPDERLAVLRKAFVAMLNDPEMVKDASNRMIELYPKDGDLLLAAARRDTVLIREVMKELGLVK